MVKKLIIVAISLAGAVLLGIKGKSILKERQVEVKTAPTPTMQVVTVSLIKPENSELQEKNRYLATLKGNKTIKVSTKLAGFIKEVYVRESQKVNAGDLLVTIDAKEIKTNIDSIRANISALRSDLEVARKVYRTNQKLYRVGGLPREKLEASAAVLKLKEAKINESLQKIKSLKNQLNYLNITAPFDGTVDAILLHEGDLAAAGRPIISMSNNKKKLIFSFVSNDGIKLNLPVLYNNDLIGKVSTIYNSAKNSLQMAEVELVKSLNLPLESSINIEVVTKSAKGCVVSNNAILHSKNATYVMEYKDKSFSPLKVDILIEDGDKVLISPCPQAKVAIGSENRLSSLTTLGKVLIAGEKNE